VFELLRELGVQVQPPAVCHSKVLEKNQGDRGRVVFTPLPSLPFTVQCCENWLIFHQNGCMRLRYIWVGSGRVKNWNLRVGLG